MRWSINLLFQFAFDCKHNELAYLWSTHGCRIIAFCHNIRYCYSSKVNEPSSGSWENILSPALVYISKTFAQVSIPKLLEVAFVNHQVKSDHLSSVHTLKKEMAFINITRLPNILQLVLTSENVSPLQAPHAILIQRNHRKLSNRFSSENAVLQDSAWKIYFPFYCVLEGFCVIFFQLKGWLSCPFEADSKRVFQVYTITN